MAGDQGAGRGVRDELQFQVLLDIFFYYFFSAWHLFLNPFYFFLSGKKRR
jgi:hypothetical protein